MFVAHLLAIGTLKITTFSSSTPLNFTRFHSRLRFGLFTDIFTHPTTMESQLPLAPEKTALYHLLR